MTDAELEIWVSEQRHNVQNYLVVEGIEKTNVGDWPAFEVAPYFAIWAIESKKEIGRIGWWAFSGDCPTDYVSGNGIDHPRKALKKLLENWKNYLPYMKNDNQPPNTTIGKGGNLLELADLLESRIMILSEWLDDESIWKML